MQSPARQSKFFGEHVGYGLVGVGVGVFMLPDVGVRVFTGGEYGPDGMVLDDTAVQSRLPDIRQKLTPDVLYP